MANNRVQLHKIRGYGLGLLAGLASLLKCSASQLNICIKKSQWLDDSLLLLSLKIKQFCCLLMLCSIALLSLWQCLF